MNNIYFIDTQNYVLFLPIIKQKIKSSYIEFNITKNSFMGQELRQLYTDIFSKSKNVYWKYKKFYCKEFKTYRDFLSEYYNLTESELNSLDNKSLRYSVKNNEKSYNRLLEIKSIRNKLNQYFNGRFFVYYEN